MSEYFSQNLNGERAVNKAFTEAKSVNERNGEQLEEARKYSIKEFSSEISIGTSSLMKGVATIKTIHAKRGKHSYAKVLLCYSSNSLRDSAKKNVSAEASVDESDDATSRRG